MSTLGIVAGGGDLPLAIAQEAGRAVYVIALSGSADDWVKAYPHDWASAGETGKVIRLLREHDCREVVLAGKVARPKWSDLKVDAKGVLALPRIVAAAMKGDDALLRAVVSLFENDGLRVIGAHEAAPALLAGEETITAAKPNARDKADIESAVKIVRALGALDVGQAAIVCEGLPLAVEAAEGTDAMIERAGALPQNVRGTTDKRRGVLVKAPKPVQDRKTDLPVIGLRTIENVAAAGLAGIALEAGGALIVNRRAVVDAANAAGLFVTGFPRGP